MDKESLSIREVILFNLLLVKTTKSLINSQPMTWLDFSLLNEGMLMDINSLVALINKFLGCNSQFIVISTRLMLS